MNPHQQLEKHVNRFKVFRACKAFMASHQRQPAVVEIAELVPDIGPYTVGRHMRALHGADGLDFPLWPAIKPNGGRLRGFGTPMNGYRMPVDTLMAGNLPNGVEAGERLYQNLEG